MIELPAEQSAGDRRRAQSNDSLSAEAFFETLRSVVGFREQPAIADPLQHTVDQIGKNPAFAQSRLLRRILIALERGGESRRAEAATLDTATQALVIALLDLHRAGTRPHQDWDSAIEAAQAVSP